MAPPTTKPLLNLFSLVPGKGMILDFGNHMELSIGATVFLSSILLLAVLERISFTNPQARILRGDLLPAMLCVLVVSGIGAGLLMIYFGGNAYFISGTSELLAIFAFTIASYWGIRRLVARIPAASAG